MSFFFSKLETGNYLIETMLENYFCVNAQDDEDYLVEEIFDILEEKEDFIANFATLRINIKDREDLTQEVEGVPKQ